MKGRFRLVKLRLGRNLYSLDEYHPCKITFKMHPKHVFFRWCENVTPIWLASGKALDVYSTLPIDEAQDYAKLKLALLRKYNLTEEGYRTKFKTSKPKQDETAAQYASRLGNYLQKWTEIAKVDKNYKGVCEFVIIDQFMHSVPKDVALFVKERKQVTSTLEDIGTY